MHDMVLFYFDRVIFFILDEMKYQ